MEKDRKTNTEKTDHHNNSLRKTAKTKSARKEQKERNEESLQINTEYVMSADSLTQELRVKEHPQTAKAENMTKGKKKKAKESKTRSYDEILSELTEPKEKNSSPIDRCVSLLNEMKLIKGVTAEQVQLFFDTAKAKLQDAWAPFLTKAFLNISPTKMGDDALFMSQILQSCCDILKSCGLQPEALKSAAKAFLETKDAAHITNYLKNAEQRKPSEMSEEDLHRISPQELACTAYILFIYECHVSSPYSYDYLVKSERAIAEYFSKIKMKEQAGKTVGNVISTRVFSTKKIAELTYLYAGTTDQIIQQDDQIAKLKTEKTALISRNAALDAELKHWKNEHFDLVDKIQELETENERIGKEHSAAENMLEFERNRFQRQMQTKEAGIAEQISEDLSLEIQAIRETAEYVDEENRRRIQRRLQRIDKILHQYGGDENA